MAQDFYKINDELRAAAAPELLEKIDRQIELENAVLKLAASVREKRIARNMTQSDLANLADLTQTEISRIEKGRYAPRLATLFALSRALGTDFVISSRDLNVKGLSTVI